MDNRCVMCGEVIPEGRMVCLSCETENGAERKTQTNQFGQLSGGAFLKKPSSTT